jgi:hypothetical protein
VSSDAGTVYVNEDTFGIYGTEFASLQSSD